jgi:thiamine-monophosphate kinase
VSVADLPGPLLSELSEGEILARIFPRLPQADLALLGPGDDAAVVTAPDGRFVVTTDTMVEGKDFSLDWSLPDEIGVKAAMSNLADVVAMGARPTALTVALAAPVDTPVAFLEMLADGLRDACAQVAPGCGVVGGDIAASDTLVIAVTAFGDLAGREPLLRSGAQVGDEIAVSGLLGVSGAGLTLLQRHGPQARDNFPDAVCWHLAPYPAIGPDMVAELAGAHSAMDISDSLSLDASRMATASGVTMALDITVVSAMADAVARVSGLSMNEAQRMVLEGGEDHAILATFPDGGVPEGFIPLGRVMAAGTHAVTLAGEGIAPAGWNPFAG